METGKVILLRSEGGKCGRNEGRKERRHLGLEAKLGTRSEVKGEMLYLFIYLANVTLFIGKELFILYCPDKLSGL